MENSARTDIFDATLSVMGNVEIGIMVNHHRTTLAKATGLGNGTPAQRFRSFCGLLASPRADFEAPIVNRPRDI